MEETDEFKIDSVDYVLEAQKEIEELKRQINTQLKRKTQTFFQRIPRSLRRRTASHNPKRVPKKFRGTAKVVGLTKPACRKKKRRKRQVLVEVEKENEKRRWLETHLWHAKRMKMAVCWGYKLALRSTTKVFKKTVQRGFSDCAIHDSSYLSCLEVKGEKEQLERLLTALGCHKKLERDREVVFMLNEEKDHGLVSVTMFLQEETALLWFWLHCSLLPEAPHIIRRALGTGLESSLLQTELVRFELSGEKTANYLSRVVRLLSPQGTVLTKEQILENLSELQEGECLASQCIDPRLGFPRYAFNYPERESQQDCVSAAIFKGEERLRSKTEQKREGELNRRREASLNEEGLQHTAEDSKIPVMLVRSSFFSLHYKGPSFSLVLPSGWAVAFWRGFIYQGVCVCGLRDIRVARLEEKEPLFPFDYVGTQAFWQYSQEISVKLMAQENRRPPGKCVNYKKKGISAPFLFPGHSSQSKLTLIEGTCFLSLLQRYSRASSAEERKGLEVEVRNKLVLVSVTAVKKGVPVEFSRLFTEEAACFGDTEAIGMVTTGGHSFLRGRGIGIACCYSSSLLGCRETSGLFSALCKRITSECCFPVVLEVSIENSRHDF